MAGQVRAGADDEQRGRHVLDADAREAACHTHEERHIRRKQRDRRRREQRERRAQGPRPPVEQQVAASRAAHAAFATREEPLVARGAHVLQRVAQRDADDWERGTDGEHRVQREVIVDDQLHHLPRSRRAGGITFARLKVEGVDIVKLRKSKRTCR